MTRFTKQVDVDENKPLEELEIEPLCLTRENISGGAIPG